MANIKDTQKAPLHPAQMKILAHMLTLPKARFKDLKLPGFTTKHITYHINKLIELGLLTKTPDKTYFLTDKGKKFVSHIDIFGTKDGKKVEYAKRTVIMRAVKKEQGKYRFLFYKRLKHPFYGYVGFPAGKVAKTESPVQTAIREFLEETGLIMRAWELIKIEHNTIYKNSSKPEFDVYYYAFNIYDFEGTLRTKSEEGEYFWATLQEFSKMKYFNGMLDGQESPTHWTHLPKLYESYLKLAQKGTWQNKPANWSNRQEFKVTYIELPEVVEEY